MSRRPTAPAAPRPGVPSLLIAGRKLVFILVVLALLASQAALGLAAAQPVSRPVVTIRDAGIETLVRRLAHPLFRAAGVGPGQVRITLIQTRAINAFVSTGNRLFIRTGLIRPAASIRELAGLLLRAGDRARLLAWHGAATGQNSSRLPPLAEAAPPPRPQRLRAQDPRHAAAPENLPPERGR